MAAEKLKIRGPQAKDAGRIAELLGELGYPQTKKFARKKLSQLKRSSNDTVLLVDYHGRVEGVAHFHKAPLFHQKGFLGRIMALVVDRKAQRKGLGQALMVSLDRLARKQQCVKIELTSGVHRRGAHRFYTHMGYKKSSHHRFLKPI